MNKINNRTVYIKKTLFYFATACVISCFGIRPAGAQQSNTLYFLENVPQKHLLNPAFQPECGFYLGLPAIAPLQLYAGNSAFSLDDVMWYDETLDSTITFLHPLASKDDFLNNFKNSNFVSAELSTAILSFGFRIQDYFISFDVSERSEATISYPSDLISFIIQGNENGETFDLSNLGVNMNSYMEFALGLSNRYSDELSFGFKTKLLFGVVNLSTANTDLTVQTGVDQWHARSKFDINASLPGYYIPEDEDGYLDFEEADFEEDLEAGDFPGLITKNIGLALDLGVDYRPSELFSLSASVLDLGFIRWGSYVHNMSQDAEFVFEGLIKDFESDSSDFEHMAEDLADSIKNTFTLANAEDPYTTFLNGKIYLGGRYNIHEKISFGFLSRTGIVRGKVRQQVTFSTNFNPFREFNASISYSIMNNTYNNLGIGISTNLGPFDLYIISDNVPVVYRKIVSTPALIPHKARTFNLRIGLNLVFGYNKLKRIQRDKPLVF